VKLNSLNIRDTVEMMNIMNTSVVECQLAKKLYTFTDVYCTIHLLNETKNLSQLRNIYCIYCHCNTI